MKKSLILIFTIAFAIAFFSNNNSNAQLPTIQDCLGAIPITMGQYYTTQSYIGEGNYFNEIDDSINCLLHGEKNDVWYSFTPANNGILNFTIGPNNPGDDYDWAVFDITNYTCADIYINPGLNLSCNYAANLGCNGTTGANGNILGTCGGQNELPVPILAEHHYVLNIGNLSATQSGYLLDLSQSTFLTHASITGSVFDDLNNDCQKTNNEITFEQQLIQVNNGIIYLVTDPQGQYQFLADTGTYQLNLIQQPYTQLLCSGTQPLTVTVTPADIDSVLPNNNFPVDTITMRDLFIDITNTAQPIPGFVFPVVLTYKNHGNIPLTGTLELKYDSLTIDSTGTVPDSIAGNTAYFSYSNLLPHQVGSITINMYCPVTLNLGSSINLSAIGYPVANDTLPADNYDTLSIIMVGSFDPNDKQVNPEGISPQGFITPLQELTYTIRFQNTGTAPAFFVKVIDSLNIDLDISTFHVISSSHPCTFTLTDPGVITWYFNTINLPDSGSNEPASHGFVKYSIKPKAGLAQYTPITNKAAIYFDFNAPVVTNTVLNTIDYTLGLSSVKAPLAFIKLFPNPAFEKITMQSNMLCTHLQVMNMFGQNLFEQRFNGTTAEINIKELAKGIYFLKCATADGNIIVKRFVKQ